MSMDLASVEKAGAWGDTVATVLSLVVQHCPAASQHPRDLCTLLQVSTTCRTALQRTKGHCCPVIRCTIKDPVNALFSYSEWAGQHSCLVKQLSVDVKIALHARSILRVDALPAAFAALSKLTSFSFRDRHALGEQVLGSLQAQSQLTQICMDMVTAGVAPHLPPSLVDAKLAVFVPASLARAPPTVWAHQSMPVSFLHLQKLRSLDLELWSPPLQPFFAGTFQGAQVSVPSTLVHLRLSGPVSAINTGRDASFPASLQQFVVSKGVMDLISVEALPKMVAGMPLLQDFGLDASLTGPDDAYLEWDLLPEVRKISQAEARPLLQAIGAATKLTALRIAGLCVRDEWEPEGEPEGLWWQQLRSLAALRELELSGDLGEDDIAAIASLTQLTCLHLTSSGGYLDDNAIERLLSPLLALQSLTIHDSELRHPEALFGAVAGLTNLRSLDMHHNFGALFYAEDLTVLRSLVGLTHLVLPPSASRACTNGEVHSCLLRHLPGLVVAKAGPRSVKLSGWHVI